MSKEIMTSIERLRQEQAEKAGELIERMSRTTKSWTDGRNDPRSAQPARPDPRTLRPGGCRPPR